jgi:tetratricopeptide (TPR) repeat protein
MSSLFRSASFKGFGRFRSLLCVLGCGTPVLCAAQSVLPRSDTQMTVPHTKDSAENARYSCQKFADDSSKAKAAAALSVQTSDKNALACAADLRFELARKNRRDLPAHVSALTSLLSYIDHVHDLKVYELSQIDWPEYDLRLEHAAKLAAGLIPATQRSWPSDPAIMILSAGIERSLAGPNEPEKTLAAVEELKRAVAKDPNALNGLGQLLIGRSYLDLPPIAGGGPAKAVPYLEQARAASAADPRASRYLAEAYEALGRPRDALAALKTLANVTPSDSNLQLYADEWRMGEGLAIRMHAPELADSIKVERAHLLQQHPNLLSRKVESVWGHGETDPLTGHSDYDAKP